jgi:amino-acid N-acetyltransferase
LYNYPDNQMAELACLAVSADYQSKGRGKQLLASIEKNALQAGVKAMYVLTTQTAHWFLEQGFKAADIADLPVEKQALYNYQRNSRVFRKQLPSA